MLFFFLKYQGYLFFLFLSLLYKIINFIRIDLFLLNIYCQIEIQTKIYKTTENRKVALTLTNIAHQRIKLGDYLTAFEEFQKVLGKAIKKFYDYLDTSESCYFLTDIKFVYFFYFSVILIKS